MKDPNQLKMWSEYAGISRSWSIAFDTKAGFMTVISLGLLAALWSGNVLLSQTPIPIPILIFGGITTLLAIASMTTALYVVIPRQTPGEIFGRHVKWEKNYSPISFYGYVAREFKPEKFDDFLTLAKNKNEDSLAYEALEQHFTISHTIQRKSVLVARSGYLLALAFMFYALTMIGRLVI